MDKYNVTGMSCAACQARVEKAVSMVPGVTSCAVSLLTNSMGVEGTASSEAVIQAVIDAGYGAELRQEVTLTDTETPILRKRLILSVVFLMILMYFSMGNMMFGFPLPESIESNHIAIGVIQMVLAAIIMYINKKFFTSGFRGLINRAPNMDTLVAMGSMVSFLWSVFVFAKMIEHHNAGDHAAVMADMDNFYFESAAMIVTLITVGKLLESISKGRTTDALKGLMKLAPKNATVMRDGKEILVPIEDVVVGDIITVRPGESIPVDGVVIEGTTTIDESSLTGESIPVYKEVDSEVSQATVNQNGYIKIQAIRIGEDTTLSQIIQMVSDAAATKAPIAKIADKVSGIFVPTVIAIAILVTLIWILASSDIGYALARGISVLVVSCPCALGLATPVAIMVGNGVGARNGILFKTATSLEVTGRSSIIVLDKTGTITNGTPKVVDVMCDEGISSDELVTKAYTLECKSEHPLSLAISEYAEEKGYDAWELPEFEAVPGMGLKGVCKLEDGTKMRLYGGNLKYIERFASIPSAIKTYADEAGMLGRTALYFAQDDKLLGVITVADTIKEDSPKAIGELKDMGINVVMLTGDNINTARAIANEVGADHVIAGVLPKDKAEVVNRLKELGNTAMVGDGINDAPALTTADMGIAIGAGADVAIDAADVVLMNSRLSDVVAAIRLSGATLRNIHENLFWAFFYNILLIPLAAGLYVNWMGGWSMNPMFAAAAMSLSSFSVCMNALRLNTVKIYKHKSKKTAKALDANILETVITELNDKFDKREDYAINITEDTKESNVMSKTMVIEGMMCPHCEATVKKTLEAIEGVESAKVSHEAGTAIVEMSVEVPDDVLTKAVTDKDYTVIEVK